MAFSLARSASAAAAAPVAGDGEPWRGAVLLTAVVIAVSLAYPAALYDRTILASLTPSGAAIFWLHTAFCAVAFLTAVRIRAAGLTCIQFFHWFFYVVAAREQFLHEWDGIFTVTEIVELGLFALLIYEVVLFAVYMMLLRLRRTPRPAAEVRPRQLAPTRRLVLLLVGCLLLQIALIAHFGAWLFSSRVGFVHRLADLIPVPQIGLIFLQFVRPLLYFIPLFILRSQCTWPHPRPTPLPAPIIALALLCSVLGFLFNTPMNSPRFHAGAIAVGTIMLFVGPRRLTILLGVLIAGTFAAPIFHMFRNEWTRKVSAGGFEAVGLGMFQTWDFDALANHFYGVYFFEKFGAYDGINLLSSLFFFIPDEIWTGKIRSSGMHVMGMVGWEFRAGFPSNSSMPMVAEGMLAFGMFGVVLVAVLFAVGVRWLDLAPTPARTAWTGLQPRMAALAFTPVLLIFLSRGPLVPAIAYSTGNWFAAGAAALLITRLLMAPTSAPTGGPSSPPAPSAKRLGDRWAQRGPIVMATETLRGARERRRSNDLHGSRHATTGIRSGTPSVSTARGALRNLPPRTGQVYE